MPQLLLDCHEIVPQQLEDLFCRRYRQCAQSAPVPVAVRIEIHVLKGHDFSRAVNGSKESGL